MTPLFLLDTKSCGECKNLVIRSIDLINSSYIFHGLGAMLILFTVHLHDQLLDNYIVKIRFFLFFCHLKICCGEPGIQFYETQKYQNPPLKGSLFLVEPIYK